jgi:hypothetical protein
MLLIKTVVKKNHELSLLVLVSNFVNKYEIVEEPNLNNLIFDWRND